MRLPPLQAPASLQQPQTTAVIVQTLLRVWTRTDGGAGNKPNKKESSAPIKLLQLQAGAMNRDLAINSRPASAMPMASKNDTENIQPLQQQCNAVKQQISSPAPPPEIIEHRMSENGRTVVKRYFKGELLGKGGFAKCYLFTDCETNDKWACKVVNKDTLKKPRHKAKLESEIKIHMKLKHPHVVYLHDAFEDKDNVYLLMELCEAQTLLELVKRKKRLADCDVRRFMHQLLNAVKYMKSQHVIHRDLKLGNLFLASRHDLKIGDFGLACQVAFEGERKRTLCGTPNYIAPEVLGQRGHSYEVDVWSVGVILYTMLVGKPPFETSDVKTTYKRIKANSFTFPDKMFIPDAAKDLIRLILQPEPSQRPTLDQIAAHEYLRVPMDIPVPLQPTTSVATLSIYTHPVVAAHAFASSLPASTPPASMASLSNPPAAAVPVIPSDARQPLKSLNAISAALPTIDAPTAQRSSAASSAASRATTAQPFYRVSDTGASASTSSAAATSASTAARPSTAAPSVPLMTTIGIVSKREGGDATHASAASAAADDAEPISVKRESEEEDKFSLINMHHHTKLCVDSDMGAPPPLPRSGTLPLPRVWVAKWVDYSKKYGLGYELSDGTNGVFFNDATKMVADSCAGGVCGTPLIEYVERVRLPSGGKQDVRRRYKEDRYPSDLKKKVTLLQHFKSFLQENEQAQVSACNDGSVPRRASDGDTVYVRKWMLTRHAIIFRLSNNNLQVNFFDQTEIFLWAEQPRFVTYVSKARQRATYDIGEAAGVPELAKRVKYVRDILAQLIGKA